MASTLPKYYIGGATLNTALARAHKRQAYPNFELRGCALCCPSYLRWYFESRGEINISYLFFSLIFSESQNLKGAWVMASTLPRYYIGGTT